MLLVRAGELCLAWAIGHTTVVAHSGMGRGFGFKTAEATDSALHTAHVTVDGHTFGLTSNRVANRGLHSSRVGFASTRGS